MDNRENPVIDIMKDVDFYAFSISREIYHECYYG